MNDLSETSVFELRNDSADIWMVAQCFNSIYNLRDEVSTDVWDSFFLIMGDDVLEITYG